MDSLDYSEAPDLLALKELHLRGLHLNRAQRRCEKYGYHLFATPATPSKLHALDADQLASLEVGEQEEVQVAGKFANHGGEGILAKSRMQVTSHHQSQESFGFKSLLIRLKGVTVHLITLYMDCGCHIDEGSNGQKSLAIMEMIKALNLPWILVGDPRRFALGSLSSWRSHGTQCATYMHVKHRRSGH